jgi:hemolysin activation/secretion protein
LNKSRILLLIACVGCIADNRFAIAGEEGAVLRNIQQNNLPNSVLPNAPSKISLPKSVDVGLLQAVEVKSTIFDREIRDYWQDRIGGQVSATDIEAFKAWAFSFFREKGYLAWVTVSEVKRPDGVGLNVIVMTPKLGKVDVDYSAVSLSESDKKKLNKWFNGAFLDEHGVDIFALDNRVQNANFGMPVEFDARLKQVVPGVTDMTIIARGAESKTGQLKNAVVQINSFGLKQYGRTQGLASLNIGGFTPMSQLSLAGQMSEGVSYGRAEYQMPFSLINGQTRFYISYADFSSVLSVSTATRGDSLEFGLGVDHLLGMTRYAAIKSHLDVSERHTKSELKQSGVGVTDVKSLQMRAALTIDNSKVDADQYDAGLSLVSGDYDATGTYGKVEFNGRYVKTLTQDRSFLLSSRFRGQVAFSTLDSFDRISLGGVNGVRAYTSVDGIGDHGALFNIDLIQRMPHQQYFGIFYDVGVVQPFKNPQQGVLNNIYTLQGAGIQYGISYQRFSLNMNVAKALGTYEGYVPGNIESAPDNWRGNISASYSF